MLHVIVVMSSLATGFCTVVLAMGVVAFILALGSCRVAFSLEVVEFMFVFCFRTVGVMAVGLLPKTLELVATSLTPVCLLLVAMAVLSIFVIVLLVAVVILSRAPVPMVAVGVGALVSALPLLPSASVTVARSGSGAVGCGRAAGFCSGPGSMCIPAGVM